jgi:hypothetical protein
MKYAFIQRNRLVWPISIQCHVLLVSVSGYHEHLARRVDISKRRHLSDEALLVHSMHPGNPILPSAFELC